jgi:hypothetical protein
MPMISQDTESINLMDDYVPFAYLSPRCCNHTTCKEAYREHEVICRPPSASRIGVYVAYLAKEHVTDAKIHKNGYGPMPLSPYASARVPPTYCGAMDMLPSFRVVLLHTSVSTWVDA